MKPKRTHNLSILLYFLVSAVLLMGTLFLGARFVGENTAVQTTAPTLPVEETAENTDTIAIEVIVEVEAPLPETLPVETEAVERMETDTVPETTVPETLPADPAERLLFILEKRAPLRWKRIETETATAVETAAFPETTAPEETTIPAETDEPEPQFEQVYPKLAYYYMDFATGTTVSYNADEILYSASLIKLPYVYAVLEEIDAFEEAKRENGEVDEDGQIFYRPEEKKYDLSEVWTYDPETMMQEGSGEIQWQEAGLSLTWRELFAYTLLYSDNIAFAQLRERFGYSSFYQKVYALGIRGVPEEGFMQLSARDCALFLEDLYRYIETDSENARMTKDCMLRSKHRTLIVAHYPEGVAAHKYGWDLGAFHDMALLYEEYPYLLVIMTDYEDGDRTATAFIGDLVKLTKEIHAGIERPIVEETTTEMTKTTEMTESKEVDA